MADGISSTKRAAAEFFIEAFDQAEDAELEVEFVAIFLREYLLTRDVYTASRDALAEYNIG